MAKIKWNMAGFQEIRRLPGVDHLLRVEVEAVLDDVGREGYDGGVEPGRTRSRGFVVTKNVGGVIDNARNASLTRALGRRITGGDA